jgi:hypothetical protein
MSEHKTQNIQRLYIVFNFFSSTFISSEVSLKSSFHGRMSSSEGKILVRSTIIHVLNEGVQITLKIYFRNTAF